MEESISAIYSSISTLPNLIAARMQFEDEGTGHMTVFSTWKQKELQRQKQVAFQKVIQCQYNQKEISRGGTFVNRLSNILMEERVKQMQAYVLLDKKTGKKIEDAVKEEQYIEIWKKEGCVRVVCPKAEEVHGDIITNAQISTFLFSPNGKYLLYVAEKKKAKSASFLDKKKDCNSDAVKGNQFLFEADWGERFSGVSNPTLVCLDVNDGTLSTISTEPFTNLSCGQAQWCADSKGIVFVGWENSPRRMGIAICFNRRSALYYHDLTTKETKRLTDNDGSVVSPRIAPSGRAVVYLKNAVDGPHRACSQVRLYDLTDGSDKLIIDVVKSVKSEKDFPGVYCFSLPSKCWSSNEECVYLDSMWRSRKVILCINLQKCSVAKVTSGVGSWTVWEVDKDMVLASHSDPITPTRLVCAKLPSNCDQSILQWTELFTSECVATTDLTWNVENFQPEGEDFSQSYDAILIKPKEGHAIKALAVCPHGGPHSTFCEEFYLWPNMIAALGYAVLLVNYRGSLGFGQDGVCGLSGKVGTQDVKDVQYATESVLRTGIVKGGKAVVFGGSHGGFVSAHLVGQYPALFQAACLRNPVINMLTMVDTTDIPDWCHYECGLPYDALKFNEIGSENYSQMLKCSPIQYVKNVNVPVLIELGDSDLRVPGNQGKQFYFALQTAGKETKLLLYPGSNHSLDEVDVDADAFVNMMLWFYNAVGV